MATLHPRMFIAQSTLEAWMDSGLATLSGDEVHLRRPGRSYRLEAAVRFESAVSEPSARPGEKGAGELLGKVLTQSRLAELGGELLEDSVLLGEVAFEVKSGFVGTLIPGQKLAQADGSD